MRHSHAKVTPVFSSSAHFRRKKRICFRRNTLTTLVGRHPWAAHSRRLGHDAGRAHHVEHTCPKPRSRKTIRPKGDVPQNGPRSSETRADQPHPAMNSLDSLTALTIPLAPPPPVRCSPACLSAPRAASLASSSRLRRSRSSSGPAPRLPWSGPAPPVFLPAPHCRPSQPPVRPARASPFKVAGNIVRRRPAPVKPSDGGEGDQISIKKSGLKQVRQPARPVLGDGRRRNRADGDFRRAWIALRQLQPPWRVR